MAAPTAGRDKPGDYPESSTAAPGAEMDAIDGPFDPGERAVADANLVLVQHPRRAAGLPRRRGGAPAQELSKNFPRTFWT